MYRPVRINFSGVGPHMNELREHNHRGLPEVLWSSKSVVAKNWLLFGVCIYSVLAAIAFVDSLQPTTIIGSWTIGALSVLAALLFLLVAAFAMHSQDRHEGGWGFLHVYDVFASSRDREARVEELVPAILTAESIRAAITTVILTGLLSNRDPLVNAGSADSINLLRLAAHPKSGFFILIVGILAGSLVMTLAGLLCYEYAARINWSRRWPQVELLRKGFQFGRWGFYCLMWSLAVTPALVDHRVAFLSGIFVFIVMWLYYFFPEPTGEEVL